MSLFNIVHILQLVIFENMLAYENFKSYILSIAYGFEQILSAENTLQIGTWFAFGPQKILLK
jgi:hypothetical protein